MKSNVFEKLKPLLEAAGAKWSEFVMPDVGHEYTPKGMAKTREWLR